MNSSSQSALLAAQGRAAAQHAEQIRQQTRALVTASRQCFDRSLRAIAGPLPLPTPSVSLQAPTGHRTQTPPACLADRSRPAVAGPPADAGFSQRPHGTEHP